MGVFCLIVAGIHMLIFDKIYLRWGKVDNIVDP
jgi:hypothetical protein